MHRAYVGLGSNLGDSIAAVERALAALESLGTVVRHSSLYRTAPWGKLDQPDFVNAVALLETTLSPRDLLAALKNIESQLGRIETERWGPRAIDLDLLTYDELLIEEPGLIVPHPQLTARAFVLVPLAEIDESYVAGRDRLPADERAGVRIARGLARFGSCGEVVEAFVDKDVEE